MSNVPSHIFRGYDIRGIAETELTKDVVQNIAKAYATFLIRRRISNCTVGYDCRLSNIRIKEEFIEALLDSGIDVIEIGLSLTQIVYFSTYFFRTKGSVMITASHNPSEYNGFKLGTGYSETMLTDEIIKIREMIEQDDFESLDKKGDHQVVDIFPEYKSDVITKAQLHKGFKLVVDSCNGTTGKFLPEILREAGCEVVEQNTELDGNFPNGTPDPTESEVLERLAKRVVEEQADLGFAYDADGDRLGIVDGKGRVVWNDMLVALLARDVLTHIPGASIVYNTLCSKAVPDTIEKAGGKPVIWMTGHSFIKAKVSETKAPFGGELSGHFYLTDNFYGHDDGAYTSLRLLSYLDNSHQTLAEAIDSLPQYISSPEIKFGLADEIKFEFVKNVIGGELKALYPDAEYIEIDGVRLDTPEEMAIVRASQNGPYITVKFEGKTQEQYDKLKGQLKHILSSHPEVDFDSGVNTHALD